MRFTNTAVGLAAIAASANAQGKTVNVTVGKNGLMYDPPSFQAAVGSSVEFVFYPKNHTVTQASFKEPCKPLEGGFNSGFNPTPGQPTDTFTITVKDDKPIWFYCGQADHCQQGMVGAINAPKTGNTFDAFKNLAKQAKSNSAPGTVSGGTKGKINGGGSASGTGAMQPSGVAMSTGAAMSSKPYTTKVYTSAWTSAGTAHTSVITTTLVSLVPAPAGGNGGSGGSGGSGSGGSGSAASTSASVAAAPTGAGFNVMNAGALLAAAAVAVL